MKKRTKQWKPKVGDAVTMTGTVTHTYTANRKKFTMVSIDNDCHSHFVELAALHPYTVRTPTEGRKVAKKKGARKH